MNKENDFSVLGAASAIDSPFSAFHSSPLKKERITTATDGLGGATNTPKKNSKTSLAQRIALSPVTAASLNNSPVSRSSSLKSATKPVTPKTKVTVNDSVDASTNLSVGDDIFSAFISSPLNHSKSMSRLVVDPVQAPTDRFIETAHSSPKPVRSSVCFGALALATSMELFTTDGQATTMEYEVATYETSDLNVSSMMLDEMIMERATFELEKLTEAETTKRTTGGSPKKSLPTLTPSKSRKALKHLRQQSLKAAKSAVIASIEHMKPKVQFEERKEDETDSTEKSTVSGANEGATLSTSGKIVKGSPSRLVKSRLVNRPSYKTRTPVLVPPSNVRPSQLKEMSPPPKFAVDEAFTAMSPTEDPLGAKNNASSVAGSAGRARAATLDETASGVFFNSFGSGGLIGGRMYDVYGFEESSIRAPVNPSSVLIANPSQMQFWTEWLSANGAKSALEEDDSSIEKSAAAGVGAARAEVSRGGSSVLASNAYSGVPHVLRGRVWANLVGVSQYRLDHSPVRGYYGELRSRGRHEKWGHQIDLDLPRTFCGHVYFRKESRGQKQLSNVLNAYSHYNEKVGYCQGMSFLVGVLLMVMEEEEKVFWTFSALMDRDGGRLASYYEPGMLGVLEDVNLFRKMILLEMPALYAHFEKVGVDASFFVTRWLLSLFTDLSDWSTVLRFWDLYMLHGHLSLFRACLAILKANLSDLLSMKNCELLFPFLLNLPFNKLNPSVIVSMYRSIDIQYLYGEVTAPDSDVKYAVSHIHQPLPHHTSKRKNSEKHLQKALSKRQLAKIAKRHEDASSRSTATDSAATHAKDAQQTAQNAGSQHGIPTTPLPRKSRPQSMMVFSSASEHSSSHQPHEIHTRGNGNEEMTTPSKSKSFFGRMWEKLKSPALSITSSAKKANAEKDTPSAKMAPTPSTPGVPKTTEKTITISSTSSASPSSPSRRQLHKTHSPSRSKSKKSVTGQVTGGTMSVTFAASDAADASLPKRHSPKRKREEIQSGPITIHAYEDEVLETGRSRASSNAEELAKRAQQPPQKKRIISWVADDTREDATKWDGGHDLFMDESERDAFIEFATATPIRGIASKTGAFTTTPRPATNASSKISSSGPSTGATPAFKLPPPPGDAKVTKDTPRVVGAPMQLAPAFCHDSSSTTTPARTPTSSRKKSASKVLSPIEMDNAWLKSKH